MTDIESQQKDHQTLVQASNTAFKTTDQAREAAAPSTDARPRRRTSSGALLQKAAEALGMDEIAKTLGVTPVALAHFVREDRTMTLAQQRTLAMAVLMLCEGHNDLRRRATALLGQVRAAAAFEAGATSVHENPPPSTGWR